MIINLDSSNGFLFTPPNITLDDTSQWYIKVNQFCAVFKVPLSKSTLFTLTTNVIARTSGNPKQIIMAFAVESGETIINILPTQFAEYKIRFHDLKTAQFILQKLTGESPEIVTSAYLQIEITQTLNGF